MKSAPIAVILTALFIVAALSLAPLPTMAQDTPPGPPNLPPGVPAPASCGWNTPANSTALVASSPAGSAVALKIGEPSWQQDCVYGTNSMTSFPEYEVFPIAIHASPNTTVTLQTGEAVPTAQQVAGGVRNATLWTWFDPGTVETGPTGAASSNLTLAGAVMPFVPNDFANVTLPIVASASTGKNGSVGLPIEFEGGVTDVLQSLGPITFGGGVQMQADASASPQFDAVYSPPGSGSPAPLQVSMSVLGAYVNGSVGPLPSDVQVSFPQQPLELPAHSLVYFNVDVSNTLQPSNSSGIDNYTFAVQERVGNATFVEPLAVSVSLGENTIFYGAEAGTMPGAASSTTSTASSSSTASAPGSQSVEVGAALATVALVAVVAGVLRLRRPKAATLPVEPT